ncbi:hypothetical protein G6F31_012949 [Rhizopus arrhizus]|nr:hypothetical protein G6F31_012949 [Rhizopus arrhizus]
MAGIGHSGKSGVIVGNEDTLVALGPLNTAPPLLALAGFLLIAVLEARRIRGAILIGILAVTAAGWALGDVQYQGLVSLPPSLAPTFLQLDLPGLLHHDGGAPIAVLLQVVLVFVLVEVFDATGTLYGVVGRAGLLKLPGAQKRFGRALLADSTAIVAGSMLGTSSTTAFAESASGVQVGGRTGLTALVVSALFLAALLFSPLAAMVPSYATAPALLFVAGLMLRELVEVDWSDLTESVPAALCALAMPFTYSIANGLAFGFIAYAALKAGTGRWREVHPAVWLVAVLARGAPARLQPAGGVEAPAPFGPAQPEQAEHLRVVRRGIGAVLLGAGLAGLQCTGALVFSLGQQIRQQRRAEAVIAFALPLPAAGVDLFPHGGAAAQALQRAGQRSQLRPEQRIARRRHAGPGVTADRVVAADRTLHRVGHETAGLPGRPVRRESVRAALLQHPHRVCRQCRPRSLAVNRCKPPAGRAAASAPVPAAARSLARAPAAACLRRWPAMPDAATGAHLPAAHRPATDPSQRRGCCPVPASPPWHPAPTTRPAGAGACHRRPGGARTSDG